MGYLLLVATLFEFFLIAIPLNNRWVSSHWVTAILGKSYIEKMMKWGALVRERGRLRKFLSYLIAFNLILLAVSLIVIAKFNLRIHDIL